MATPVAANMPDPPASLQTGPSTRVPIECSCGFMVDPAKYNEHVASDHKLFAVATVAPSKDVKNLQLMTCDCGATVDVMKYGEHINSEHKLCTVNIRGVGPTIVQPQNPTKAVRYLDIPYYGHVRADAFLILTFLLLILGVLMGSGALR